VTNVRSAREVGLTPEAGEASPFVAFSPGLDAVLT
jgi:hypothetical protein